MFRASFSRLGCVILATAVTGVVTNCNVATAQSLFGSNGTGSLTGASSFSGSTAPGGATRASGTTGVGGTALGGANQLGAQNSLNTSGLGAQTGMTGPQLNTGMGELGATIGQGGFVGGSDTAGRFVGNQTAGQQTIQGTNTGPQGNTGAGFNQQNLQNQQLGLQARRIIRPRMKIAFNSPQRTTTNIQTGLTAQFRKMPSNRPGLRDVQLQIGTNREVVLRGQVSSAEDKKLAAMLARLEPGVRSVKNEITVGTGN